MNDKPIRILRAPHDKENPYVMIRRAVPQNRYLSWAARGVLSYLLSKSDDWVIEPKDLEQGCGRDKVYSVLTEITEAGYLERFQIIGERGRFEDFEYHLHEVPLPAKPDTDKPLPAKPDHTYKREDQLNKDSSFAANAAGSNSNSQIAEATQSPMVSSSDYPWYIEGTLWAESEYSLDGAISKVQELDNLSFSSEDIKAFTAGFNEIRLSAIDSDDRIDADSDPSGGEPATSDALFGSDTPPVNYVLHPCPKCGTARVALYVPTGDAPPKPVGEVIRRTNWVCYSCDHCDQVEVSGKNVYVGDGDYDLIRGFAPVFIDWNEWAGENYYQDGRALTARYSELIAPEDASAKTTPFKTISRRPSGIQSDRSIVEGYVPPKGRGQHRNVNPETAAPTLPAERHFLTPKTQNHMMNICQWLDVIREYVPLTFDVGVCSRFSKEITKQGVTIDRMVSAANLYKAWLEALPAIPGQTWDVAMIRTAVNFSLGLEATPTTCVEVTKFVKYKYEEVFWKSQSMKFGYVCANIGAWKAAPQSDDKNEPEFVTITVMSDWGTKIDKSVPRSELHKYTQVER